MGTNSLTYYDTKFITVVKSLIIQVEREKKDTWKCVHLLPISQNFFSSAE
jgi:hypothetical protein